MHIFPATNEAHAQGTVTAFTYLLRIDPLVGPKEGYTSFYKDLPYDDGDGELTYVAGSGGKFSGLTRKVGPGRADQEVEWAINDVNITEEKLLSGYYDRAQFRFYRIVWDDLSIAPAILDRGEIDGVRFEGIQARATLVTLLEAYQQKSGAQTLVSKCPYTFGDSDCGAPIAIPTWSALEAITAIHTGLRDDVGFQRAPTTFNDRRFLALKTGTTGAAEPTWTLAIDGQTSDGTPPNEVIWLTQRARLVPATVDVVTGNGDFTLTVATDAPDGYFAEGLITFDPTTGGANAGRSMDIFSWTLGTKRVVLKQPMELPVVNGDVVLLTAGCVHGKDACNAHKNGRKYGGWGLYAPDPDTVINLD